MFGGVSSFDDTLFKAVQGGLLTATPVDREIKRICKEAGIQPFGVHALRATWATRAIESGRLQIKTVQELMGYKDFGLSYSLYGHC